MPHHKYQYVVICRVCGIQPLSYDDYIEQLEEPSNLWRCPLCELPAEWDDDSLETNPPTPPEDE